MSKNMFIVKGNGSNGRIVRNNTLDFNRLKGNEIIFHLREKSGWSFIKKLLNDISRQTNRPVYFAMNYSIPIVLKCRHIIHIRDYRDMAISQYWSTFTHPKGPGDTVIKGQLELLGNDPKNPKMSVDDFIDREDEWDTRKDRLVHTDGYTTRFFRECIIPEYNSVLSYSSSQSIKIVYYDDMVTDFSLYLNEINALFGDTLDIEALYDRYNHEFKPEAGPWDDPNIPMNTFQGHRRRVFPGGYKEEMSTELSNYFNEQYKKYPFLRRYINL